MNKSNIILVLVVAVLGLAFLVWGLGGDQGSTPEATLTPTPTTQQLVNSISVSDQSAANSVVVDSVNFESNGYIVIHQDADGAPGDVIGNSTLLDAGSHADVSVQLNREAADGETFWAMLHTDDGDGEYDFPESDGPIKGDDGKIVMVSFQVGGDNSMMEEDSMMEDDDSMMEEGSPPMSVTITVTDDGFSPSEATVAAGGTVTWTNESSNAAWPASAMHPTHTVYPESNITKCGTDEEDSIFDACRGLAPGESYSFTFNESGEWGFHDHLAPQQWGKVIVVQ